MGSKETINASGEKKQDAWQCSIRQESSKFENEYYVPVKVIDVEINTSFEDKGIFMIK